MPSSSSSPDARSPARPGAPLAPRPADAAALPLARWLRQINPATGSALRRVRAAYAAFDDSAVIATCRSSAEGLAQTLTLLTGQPVAPEALCALCADYEPWAERQAWERLLAQVAVIQSLLS